MIELSILASWAAIPTFEKVFWFVALPFSLFGLLTVFSALFGLDGEGGDADVGAAEGLFGVLKFFSVKNMIMFFAVFGWVGIVCARAGWPKAATTVTAVLSGAVAAVIFAILFRLMYRLNESGTIQSLDSAVDELGTVYLPVPAERKGTGKVQIIIHSSLREIEAITDGDELATGVKVKVTGLLGKNTLVVEKV